MNSKNIRYWVSTIFLMIALPIDAMNFSSLQRNKKNGVQFLKKSVKKDLKSYCSAESPWGSKTTKTISVWNKCVIGGIATAWISGNTVISYNIGSDNGALDTLDKKIAHTRSWLVTDFLRQKKINYTKRTFPERLGFIVVPLLSEAALWQLGKSYPKGLYLALQAACFGVGYMMGKIKEK